MVGARDVMNIWRHRALISMLARREVVGRYKGSVLGLLWSFLQPLLMLVVYAFVFGVIFNSRWPANELTSDSFPAILFAGMLVFNLFAECVNRSPSLIQSNVNFVKKVVFPLEILPCVIVFSALAHASVSLIILLAFLFCVHGTLPWTIVLFPLVLAPLSLFVVGLSWALSAVGVYFRDLVQVVGVLTSSLMFLSPIFYPVTAIPEKYRFLIEMNPLTYFVENTRAVLVFGQIPDLHGLVWWYVIALFVVFVGLLIFRRFRSGFADVV